jgi:hypothetical protein
MRVAMVACLIVGLGLMIPFEATLTRILGMAALAAFIVLGVFAIAEPGFLAGDGDEAADEDEPGDRDEG